MDLPSAEDNLAALKQRYPDRVIVPVSAKNGTGVDEFKRRLAELVQAARPG